MAKFLADESCPDPVVEALQAAGHDVICAADIMLGAPDDKALEAAARDVRIVIAQDRDFGELIVRRGQLASGYVLLRLKGRDWARVSDRVVKVIASAGDLSGSILVIGWTTSRRRPLP